MGSSEFVQCDFRRPTSRTPARVGIDSRPALTTLAESTPLTRQLTAERAPQLLDHTPVKGTGSYILPQTTLKVKTTTGESNREPPSAERQTDRDGPDTGDGEFTGSVTRPTNERRQTDLDDDRCHPSADQDRGGQQGGADDDEQRQ